MQLWQCCLLVTARSLWMFRTLPASIIRITKTVVAATGARHAPVAATTVFSTPDDGRRKRPKHPE